MTWLLILSLLLLFRILLLYFFLLFYAYGYFARVHFYASCVCLVPSDTRSVCWGRGTGQISWNWSNSCESLSACWGLNLVLQEQPVLLTTESSFQPQLLIMCVGVCTLWQVPVETRLISFPGVGVTAVVSILKWVPGTELRFSVREIIFTTLSPKPSLQTCYCSFLCLLCVSMHIWMCRSVHREVTGQLIGVRFPLPCRSQELNSGPEA